MRKFSVFRTKTPLQQGKIPSRLSTAPIKQKIAEFSGLTKFGAKITEIRGWQDVDQVMPLVEKCIKAGSEKVRILTRSYLIERWWRLHFLLKHNAAHAPFS